jgi:hypothetical protein
MNINDSVYKVFARVRNVAGTSIRRRGFKRQRISTRTMANRSGLRPAKISRRDRHSDATANFGAPTKAGIQEIPQNTPETSSPVAYTTGGLICQVSSRQVTPAAQRQIDLRWAVASDLGEMRPVLKNHPRPRILESKARAAIKFPLSSHAAEVVPPPRRRNAILCNCGAPIDEEWCRCAGWRLMDFG